MMTNADGSPRSVSARKKKISQDEATAMMARKTRSDLNASWRQYASQEQVEDFRSRTFECETVDEIMDLRKEMLQARRETRKAS